MAEAISEHGGCVVLRVIYHGRQLQDRGRQSGQNDTPRTLEQPSAVTEKKTVAMDPQVET